MSSNWNDPSTGTTGDWNTGTDSNWNSGTVNDTWVSGDARNAVDTNGADFDNDFGGTSGDAGAGGQGDDACRNCGEAGHFARECTQPRKMGACFNCGEEGHARVDCSKPRVFKGVCNSCGEEGHPAADCPNKPKICRNCLQDGHDTLECTDRKAINNDDVPDKTVDEAWAMLKQASSEKDLDDFKDAVKILVKADATYTYPKLEKEFRARGFKVYLIAMEKDTGDTWTNVNLQGEIEKKFAVGYYFSSKAQRPTLAAKWPSSVEENLERLADAGIPMDRGVEKCNNCGKLGHVKRFCPDEIIPIEQVTITCALCGEAGHRVRDCKEERQKPREPRACKVCEETNHIAKDCPKREKRTCRKCGSEDHMAKECEIIKCDNCDAIGHTWRDCTAPKDWSRVTCRNCGEKGHTVKRCKEPVKDKENAGPSDGGANGFDQTDTTTGGGGGWDDGNTAVAASGNNDWENATAAPITTGGGW